MKIFFSVGEPSGDLHGANLIRRLRQRAPSAEFVGYGGPKMAAAGCTLHEDLTQLAVMFLAGVFANLHRFWSLYRRASLYMREHRPDAVVLIDYPGFNWWVARAAKREGIPVFFYGAPQIWAWGRWRLGRIRRLVDHVLCKLPFEARWYQERGCNAHFVGHPYFDELRSQQLDEAFLEEMRARVGQGNLIAILPGSRTMEVDLNLPVFLKAAERIQSADASVRFAVASYNEKQAETARRMVADSNVAADVQVGRTAELISLSHSCLACSGSVSLELLYHGKPSVVYYRVSRFIYGLVRFLLIRVRYITLVNLLACEDRFDTRKPYDPDALLFPEYPTFADKSEQLAEHVLKWLGEPSGHQKIKSRLQELKDELGASGASERAADYILGQLKQSESGRAAA